MYYILYVTFASDFLKSSSTASDSGRENMRYDETILSSKNKYVPVSYIYLFFYGGAEFHSEGIEA